jgi:hypothetical protein
VGLNLIAFEIVAQNFGRSAVSAVGADVCLGVGGLYIYGGTICQDGGEDSGMVGAKHASVLFQDLVAENFGCIELSGIRIG